MSKLAEYREHLSAKRVAYHEKYKQHEDELTDEVISELDTLQKEIIGLDTEVKKLEQATQAAAENESAMKDLNDPAKVIQHPGQVEQKQSQNVRERKSIGQQFAESDQYKSWLAGFPNQQIPDSYKGLNSPAVEYKDLITGVDATSAGAFIIPDQYPGLVEPGRRPLVMRDIITTGSTTSDSIQYVRVTAETNNAAMVAEATATGGASGQKPESALAFERVDTSVKTVAHWIPITKRALSDAGQVRTYIDNFLRDGLNQVIEDQVVSGDGTGENFTGLSNTSGVQSQAWDTDVVTTARKGRTLVRTVGRAQANAYLMHPNTWEAIDLLQDNEARYYYGGPQNMGAPRLWGLPVVESEAVAEDTMYVGDFRQLVLWDREQASIQATDSHSDFFTRNMVAILAEMRAAFGVLKPAAIVEMPTEAPA